MTSPASLRLSLALALAFPAIAGSAQNPHPAAQPAGGPAADPAGAAVQYGKLPLSFEPNMGQTSNQVQWLARGPRYTLYLAGHDAVLQMTDITAARPGVAPKVDSSAVRMNLLGAQKVERADGEDLQAGKSNYFTGKDPAKWQHNVSMYGKVRLKEVYPGVDLVYYGRQGQLEYDFVVAPGADPGKIRWGFDGAKARIAENGDLVLPIANANGGAGKEIRLNKPVVYQLKGGARVPVEGSFAIAKNEASFKLGAYDRSRELVIDPTLVFLGVIGAGSSPTEVNGMALDTNVDQATGNANEMILTGLTAETSFPATMGAYQTSCTVPNGNGMATRCQGSNATSAYVARFSADGSSLIYATYLHGGDGYENGIAAAVDSLDDDVVILGDTSSNDFPITTAQEQAANASIEPAYQAVCLPYYNGGNPNVIIPNCDGYFAGGGTEWVIQGPSMFISKLDPTGSKLLYSTFFSGTDFVYAEGLALDSSDNIYFTGYEQAAQATANVYPNNGNQFVQFPLTSGAFQSQLQGQPAATISVLSADGQTLMYSSFLGDPKNSNWNVPEAIAVSPTGLVAIGGVTDSASIPTTSGSVRPSCVQPSPANGNCMGYTAWLSVFDPTQQGSASLVYSTYIGGPEVSDGNNTQNSVQGLAFDGAGNLYITGNTLENNYPTTPGVFQTTCNHDSNPASCNAAFLSKLDLNNGSQFVWSTYFGNTRGYSQTAGNAIAIDSRGWVYLYGYNNGYGWDCPVLNPIEAQNGNNFAFVAALSSDAKQLLFSTPVFEAQTTAYGAYSVPNGFALDSNNNIYVAGYGNDGGSLQTTTGAYAETAVGGWNRSFFAEISKVLGPVATNLTIAPLNVLPGGKVTFTATIVPTAETTPTPTGSVTVINNNTTPPTTLGTITLGAGGSGSFSTSALGRGQYSVIGNYSGDSSYETGASAAQTLTVNQFQPKLTVTASASTILRIDGLTVTVTAGGGSGNPVPTGSVTLSSGSYTSSPATMSGGVAKIVIPANVLNDGADTLLATYSPDAGSIKTYRSSTGSATVTVGRASQTIHFTAPPSTVKYGVKPIKLTATASSGLKIAFTVVSGHGKISGDELTITGAGDLEVEAIQSGNESYKPAVTRPYKIAVEKGTQTIDFNPPSHVGVSTIPATITLSATATSHLAVTFKVISGSATVKGDKLTIDHLGTIVVAANQTGNANWDAAKQVKGTITAAIAPK